MNKILLFTLSLISFAIVSCSHSEINESDLDAHPYEIDAQVLNKFVDINKEEGEYFINESLRHSALSYITNEDWNELQAVTPGNRLRFEQELSALNAELAFDAQREDVSHIVYNTYTQTWIRKIDKESPIEIKQAEDFTQTLLSRANYASFSFWAPAQMQTINFTAGKHIISDVYVEMYRVLNYRAELTCTAPYYHSVIISGTGVRYHTSYDWNAPTLESSVKWTFKGKMTSPARDPSANIRVDFID